MDGICDVVLMMCECHTGLVWVAHGSETPILNGNVPGEQGASPRCLSHLCSPAQQRCCTLSPSSPGGSIQNKGEPKFLWLDEPCALQQVGYWVILAAMRSQAATLCTPESQETSLRSRHSKWLLLLGCPKLNIALTQLHE